ncbi:MAG: hypothetical protein WC494_00250 [Candidatus Pacearchaeota archaeon]
MRRKKIIKKALRRINLSELSYEELKRTPEGCLEIYRRYLPLIVAERGIPSEEFVGLLDIYFERALMKSPEEISSGYFDEYNSLFDEYSPKNLPDILKRPIAGEIIDFRDEMDSMEPSDRELSLLEVSLA